MKELMKIIPLLLALVISASISLEAVAQEKVDVVILKNGEQKEGKVTGITEDVIKFRYTGEEFDYELPKSDVLKVQFASGREETFGNADTGALVSTTPAPTGAVDFHNKIAVLPFQFISNDPGMDKQSMSGLAQNTTANSIREMYGNLTLQDPMTTNALLAKQNIDYSNIVTMTPAEVANLLGVEYVVYGTVNLTNKGAMTIGSSGTNYKERNKTDYQRSKSDQRTKGSEFTTSSSTTQIEYDTSVDFRLFNNKGTNLYSDSRHVFGSSVDSYTSGIDYMIKRTPFGSKYGKK
ncbi:hypothetical protein [Algoriphagus machipongonensis]|uniref:Uncharacterized protein n=1 Tax=Algoriphagus machipongonensis TaxID=388413 RepID=A3I1U7_9BACT|nr:hypothetical protein [Algoriphagus machipongonensis]EAZ79763.2 hypothetical protein ALPR1_09063 [Algoriphagus machipongonensis]